MGIFSKITHIVLSGIDPNTRAQVVGIRIAFNLHRSVVEASGQNARVLTTESHIEHAGGDIIAVAVGESRLVCVFVNAAIGTNIEFLRISGVEDQSVKTNMEVSRIIIIGVAYHLLSDIVAIATLGSHQCPKIITKHINQIFIIRRNHEAVVVGSIATIHGMALGVRHGRQCHRPVGALVFGHENASMVAIGIDASHIDDIGIRGSDGEVDHSSGLGQKGITLQRRSRA